MTRILLLPCAGTEHCEVQLGMPLWVRHWAQQAHTHTVLLHVLPGDLLQAPAPVCDEARQAALENMARWQARLTEMGLSVTTELRIGDPAEEIRKAAALLPASAIAMATHGRDGLDRMLHGSVAESVMRGSDIPAMLWSGANQRRTDATRPHPCILVPVAGPDSAEPLLPDLTEMARDHDAEVILFHDELGRDDLGESQEPSGSMGYVEGLRARLSEAGIPSKSCTRSGGHIVHEILAAAQQHDVDLIAMTTHARDGLARLLVGSVAEKVLRQADCPVWLRHLQPHGRPTPQVLEEKYLG